MWAFRPSSVSLNSCCIAVVAVVVVPQLVSGPLAAMASNGLSIFTLDRDRHG
jgi:hypothetical protein